MKTINNKNLTHFSKINVPKFDRNHITPGIVHIGMGNFHRAHQAWYLQQIMNLGEDHDWGIVGAGVRAQDEHMRLMLIKQDYLFTLIELEPQSQKAEIVGTVIDFVEINKDNHSLIATMQNPAIRIVSLTVTEGGYYLNQARDGLNLQHPDIQHDMLHPHKPVTAFGAIVLALKYRFDNHLKPFTVLSCDNLEGNGDITRRAILGLANSFDNRLAQWINDEGSFPNSMVDCIVPMTGTDELILAHSLGVDDAVPVTHEGFRQWVIEDDFCANRPNWEAVGVTLTRSVKPYEIMKLRILNGGHQVIALAGELLHYNTIAESMQWPIIKNFYYQVAKEIQVHVKSVPGMSAQDYVSLIAKRFSNPKIIDTTRRVAFDGSHRHPSFILPSIMDGLKTNQPISGLTLVCAMWAKYCTGVREDGTPIEANDPHWDYLRPLALKAREEPRLWLENKMVYGNLIKDEVFVEAFTAWLNHLYDYGVRATLESYVNKQTCEIAVHG